MNGKLYIIYTSGNNWYCMSSDGFGEYGEIKWGEPTHFFTSTYTPQGVGGTVFHVPDAEQGFREILMLAYAPNPDFSVTPYFFFDGVIGYSEKHLLGLGVTPFGRSVRLYTGTVNGYTYDKYAIQVFTTAAQDGKENWANIFHSEYIPSGPDGDQGTWSPWRKLDLSGDDTIHCTYPYQTDTHWAITTSFNTLIPGYLGSVLQIWTDHGMRWHFTEWADQLDFRILSYMSDWLIPSYTPPPTEVSDLSSTSVLLGVIEGTPPFPENAGIPDTEAANTSVVTLTKSEGVIFSTTYTFTAGVTVSYGKKFGPVETQAKLSTGVKFANKHAEKTTITYTDTLKNYNYTYPGGIGWVLYLKPDIRINQYKLTSYNMYPLAYDGNTDEFRISAITYGSNSTLEKKAFYLDDPSGPMGGTDTSTAIFEGMLPGPLSYEIDSWPEPFATDSYRILKKLPSLSSTQGDLATETILTEQTDVVTQGYSVGFSMKAKAFGIESEASANYSMDFETTTSMQYGLGFLYAVPACEGPGSTSCCVSDVTVVPYILVPKDGDAGYNAPWISDQIRLYRKPKPWYLTYSATPSNTCLNNGLGAARITVEKFGGTVFLDETGPNRDRLSARIALAGIEPDFILNGEERIHVRLANHIADTDRLQVISREVRGKNLFLTLRGATPESSIRIKLFYDARRSRLDIDLDAVRVDLTGLYSYPFLRNEESSGGERDTVPFGIYLGEKYFAKGDMDVRCAINEQNTVCNFHSKRN